MGRAEKRNHTKQVQKNRKERINKEIELYANDGAYKVFTVVNLTSVPLDIDMNLKYNYRLKITDGYTLDELSFISRSSDLLILTVTDSEISEAKIEVLKRFVPSVVVVCSPKHKGIARKVAKEFGGASICEISMLSSYLSNLQTETSSICKNRPYMVVDGIERDGNYVYVEGFMKKGLQSEYVVINGSCTGVVEEVQYDDKRINGESLRQEIDMRQVEDGTVEASPVVSSFDEEAVKEDEESSNEEDAEYDLDEVFEEQESLITKYKDYSIIRNLTTSSLPNDKEPDYYKDLIFLKGQNYLQNVLSKRPSLLPSNRHIKMKIRLLDELHNYPFLVIFGLYEYETRATITNYEFSSDETPKHEVIIDNGYRIFSTSVLLSKNTNSTSFEEERNIKKGVVSFIGPLSLFSNVAYLFYDDKALRICNGYSGRRVFYHKITLKGYPMKIMKKHVVIRGMFSTKKEVEHYKDVKLEAGLMNTGFIRRPLGTKGLFKAHFSHPIKHGDEVTFTLYKQVYL